MALGAADHPWLVPPKGALAGSAAHIALLAAAESVTRSRDARVARADISPLIAQPVAEACLRVPSWLWTRDGHNRAIARDAFRAALPPASSEEHTSELQSLIRISYAGFCLKNTKISITTQNRQ